MENPFTTTQRCLALLLGGAMLGMAGCGTVAGPTDQRTARNTPLCPAGSVPTWAIAPASIAKQCGKLAGGGVETIPMPVQKVPRARSEFSASDTDVPDVFVGLSISGGGSRAAVFGMAVMRHLHELGILQHVSAISTTSGGGLAGAYYALNGPGMDWDKAQDLMAADYLSPWIRRNLAPASIRKVLTTNEDRSDIMTDLFDENLFKHATYGSLGRFAKGKAPIWLANATEVGASRRFTFSESAFTGINSNLATFPIAQAVQASAAFPAAFNTVTLFDFQAVLPGGAIDPKSAPAPTYRHVLDGGTTDNLGIEALLALARSHHVASGNWRVPEARKRLGQCLLIVVDAYPRGVPDRYTLKDDLRGAAGRLIDLNVLDSTDAMLVTLRRDLLAKMGLQDSGSFGRRRAPQFLFFDSPPFEQGVNGAQRIGASNLYPSGYPEGDALELAASTPLADNRFRCAAWHVNLSGLDAIRHYVVAPDGNPAPGRAGDDIEEQRALNELVVSQIDTNFKLGGPKDCTPGFLDSALREAAFVLVKEDYESRFAACRWLRQNGLGVDARCGDFRAPLSSRLPLRNKVTPIGMRVAGGLATSAVQCRKDSPLTWAER